MNTEKRVINIDKELFDDLKKYSEENSLNLVKWIENTMKKEVERNNTSPISVTEFFEKVFINNFSKRFSNIFTIIGKAPDNKNDLKSTEFSDRNNNSTGYFRVNSNIPVDISASKLSEAAINCSDELINKIVKSLNVNIEKKVEIWLANYDLPPNTYDKNREKKLKTKTPIPINIYFYSYNGNNANIGFRMCVSLCIQINKEIS